jgi:predicted DNA-binding protein (MmcQ/YjbR family)
MVQWEADLLFKVGDKTFVFAGLNPPHSISVKCTEEGFHTMIEREGIQPAAYVGRFKWISIPSLTILSDKEMRSLVKTSYDLVFAKLPKKARESIAGKPK